MQMMPHTILQGYRDLFSQNAGPVSSLISWCIIIGIMCLYCSRTLEARTISTPGQCLTWAPLLGWGWGIGYFMNRTPVGACLNQLLTWGLLAIILLTLYRGPIAGKIPVLMAILRVHLSAMCAMELSNCLIRIAHPDTVVRNHYHSPLTILLAMAACLIFLQRESSGSHINTTARPGITASEISLGDMSRDQLAAQILLPLIQVMGINAVSLSEKLGYQMNCFLLLVLYLIMILLNVLWANWIPILDEESQQRVRARRIISQQDKKAQEYIWLEKENDSMTHFRHDYQNQIGAIDILIESGCIDDAIQTLDQLSALIDGKITISSQSPVPDQAQASDEKQTEASL